LCYFDTVAGPSIVTHPTDMYAATPFSGVFTCSAKGYGNLSIAWYKIRYGLFTFKPLPGKYNVSVIRSPEIIVSTLKIPNPTNEDAGTYICFVWSSYNNKATWSDRASLYISG